MLIFTIRPNPIPKALKKLGLGILLMWGLSTAFAQDPLNALVGDEGYIQKFGQTPDASASECDRIVAHLEYVSELLSRNTPDSLDPVQRKNRQKCLRILDAYTRLGQFPENREYPGRRPIFIDPNGTYCAVGYLIAETAGPTAAQAIDAKHHADFVLDMDANLLQPWATENGFSIRELAMIQPGYGCGRPLPQWQGGFTLDLLKEAGIECPEIDGPYLLECEFYVDRLVATDIVFSDDTYPELNRKIRRLIFNAKYSAGNCWASPEQIVNDGPFYMRILFDTTTFHPERNQNSIPTLEAQPMEYMLNRALAGQAAQSPDRFQNAQVSGTVREEWLGGRPLAELEVSLMGPDETLISATQTDENGWFQLSVPHPGPGARIAIRDMERERYLEIPLEWATSDMQLYLRTPHTNIFESPRFPSYDMIWGHCNFVK